MKKKLLGALCLLSLFSANDLFATGLVEFLKTLSPEKRVELKAAVQVENDEALEGALKKLSEAEQQVLLQAVEGVDQSAKLAALKEALEAAEKADKEAAEKAAQGTEAGATEGQVPQPGQEPGAAAEQAAAEAKAAAEKAAVPSFFAKNPSMFLIGGLAAAVLSAYGSFDYVKDVANFNASAARELLALHEAVEILKLEDFTGVSSVKEVAGEILQNQDLSDGSYAVTYILKELAKAEDNEEAKAILANIVSQAGEAAFVKAYKFDLGLKAGVLVSIALAGGAVAVYAGVKMARNKSAKTA